MVWKPQILELFYHPVQRHRMRPEVRLARPALMAGLDVEDIKYQHPEGFLNTEVCVGTLSPFKTAAQ